jgi:mannose-6-phosphate isomerase-like protein (cupin superfamily)
MSSSLARARRDCFARLKRGDAETRHYHERAHQFFYILSGRATFEIGGEEFALTARQGIAVAPRAPHRLSNKGDEELTFLVISAPPSHGDRILVED